MAEKKSNSLFSKICIILRDVFDVYGLRLVKFVFLAILLASLSSYFSTADSIKNVISDSISFFATLIVVEIAFFGIFFSGSANNEKAKKMIINEEENISYYQSLLIKNFLSISLKMINIISIFLISLFNISVDKNVYSFNGIEIHYGIYLLIFFLIILALTVMVDLVVSIYFFLWKS